MYPLISVKNLGKRYRRYHTQRSYTFMEATLSGWRLTQPADQFWALQDINLEVFPGEMLGVIGRNGAGKSTLLQLVGQVSRPDEGEVKVIGKIGALLDLGASLSNDLTGRENILVNGVISGLKRREAKLITNTIIRFSELENFIDNPVRAYSSGMRMRLAFSIAIHTKPDVLLVDEFLSVGDLSFRKKCLDKIAELQSRGCAILFVSHDVKMVSKMCSKVLWLENGMVKEYGAAKETARKYLCTVQRKNLEPAYKEKNQIGGDDKKANHSLIKILRVSLEPSLEISSGDPLTLSVEYMAFSSVKRPIFSLGILTQEGKKCFSTNTRLADAALEEVEGQGEVIIEFGRLDLAAGEYFINVGIYADGWEQEYDYHWRAYSFFIASDDAVGEGMLHPPMTWKMKKIAPKRN